MKKNNSALVLAVMLSALVSTSMEADVIIKFQNNSKEKIYCGITYTGSSGTKQEGNDIPAGESRTSSFDSSLQFHNLLDKVACFRANIDASTQEKFSAAITKGEQIPPKDPDAFNKTIKDNNNNSSTGLGNLTVNIDSPEGGTLLLQATGKEYRSGFSPAAITVTINNKTSRDINKCTLYYTTRPQPHEVVLFPKEDSMTVNMPKFSTYKTTLKDKTKLTAIDFGNGKIAISNDLEAPVLTISDEPRLTIYPGLK